MLLAQRLTIKEKLEEVPQNNLNIQLPEVEAKSVAEQTNRDD